VLSQTTTIGRNVNLVLDIVREIETFRSSDLKVYDGFMMTKYLDSLSDCAWSCFDPDEFASIHERDIPYGPDDTRSIGEEVDSTYQTPPAEELIVQIGDLGPSEFTHSKNTDHGTQEGPRLQQEGLCLDNEPEKSSPRDVSTASALPPASNENVEAVSKTSASKEKTLPGEKETSSATVSARTDAPAKLEAIFINKHAIELSKQNRKVLSRIAARQLDKELMAINKSTKVGGVVCLLQQGADANANLTIYQQISNDICAPPLYQAIANSNFPCATALLQYGADPNCGFGNRSPLHHILKQRNHGFTLLLLRFGAVVALPMVKDCVVTEDTEFLKLLLEFGAAVGRDELLVAIKLRNALLVEIILDQDVKVMSNDLQAALERQGRGLEALFTSYGVFPSPEMLELALARGNHAITTLLLDRGAVPSNDLFTIMLAGDSVKQDGDKSLSASSVVSIDPKTIELLLGHKAQPRPTVATLDAAINLFKEIKMPISAEETLACVFKIFQHGTPADSTSSVNWDSLLANALRLRPAVEDPDFLPYFRRAKFFFLQLTIDNGANVNTPLVPPKDLTAADSLENSSSLGLAINSVEPEECYNVVLLLLQSGADPNYNDLGIGPLEQATELGYTPVVELLLRTGAVYDKKTYAPLLYKAIRNNWTELVLAMLSAIEPAKGRSSQGLHQYEEEDKSEAGSRDANKAHLLLKPTWDLGKALAAASTPTVVKIILDSKPHAEVQETMSRRGAEFILSSIERNESAITKLLINSSAKLDIVLDLAIHAKKDRVYYQEIRAYANLRSPPMLWKTNQTGLTLEEWVREYKVGNKLDKQPQVTADRQISGLQNIQGARIGLKVLDTIIRNNNMELLTMLLQSSRLTINIPPIHPWFEFFVVKAVEKSNPEVLDLMLAVGFPFCRKSTLLMMLQSELESLYTTSLAHRKQDIEIMIQNSNLDKTAPKLSRQIMLCLLKSRIFCTTKLSRELIAEHLVPNSEDLFRALFQTIAAEELVTYVAFHIVNICILHSGNSDDKKTNGYASDLLRYLEKYHKVMRDGLLLFYAAVGEWHRVEELLDNGADVNAHIHYAEREDLHGCQMMHFKGPCKNCPRRIWRYGHPGCTPLYHAIDQGNKEWVDRLIKRGADVNFQHKVPGNMKVPELSKSKGFSKAFIDKVSRRAERRLWEELAGCILHTPLHLAVYRSYHRRAVIIKEAPSIVKLLHDAGASEVSAWIDRETIKGGNIKGEYIQVTPRELAKLLS